MRLRFPLLRQLSPFHDAEVDANVTVGVVGRVVRVGGKAVCVCVSADVAAGNSGGLLIDRYVCRKTNARFISSLDLSECKLYIIRVILRVCVCADTFQVRVPCWAW